MVYLQYVRYLQFYFHRILEPTIFSQIRGQWAVLSLSAGITRGAHDARADAEDVAGYRTKREKGILAFILGLECAGR